jgi:hypothetical protein
MSTDGHDVTVPNPSDDDRWRALVHGLGQLSRFELLRLRRALRTPRGVILDGFNYEPIQRLWCPLAIALDVPKIAAEEWSGRTLTNRSAKSLIIDVGREKHGGFSLNPMHGVRGEYFRHHRYRDLVRTVDWMLATA